VADTTPTGAEGPDAPEAGTAAGTAAAGRPRPSAAAAAASRARRIGGRVGAARSGPPDPTAAVDAGPSATEPVADPATQPVDLNKAAGDSSETGWPLPPPPRPAPAVPDWLRWIPAGLLSAGAITMAVLLIVFSHGVWWGRPSGAVVREQMLAAAKTCVAQTNTYKYTALDKYTAAANACTTGRLTGQLQKTIKTVIKKYAPGLKATQTAQISRGALEAVSPHGKQWTVLVFGQLTVVNTNDPKGRTDPFAAQVQMEKVNGKWLMSGLKTVATPVS
jgi:hypothetical protein